MGVGLCSAGYHMTLKYHTQMCTSTLPPPGCTQTDVPPADELSMHLLTTPLIYRLLTYRSSPRRTRLVGAVLAVLFTVVMVTHMVMDEFLLHATTFGMGVYIIATRSIKLIPLRVTDAAMSRALRNVSRLGLGMLSA